MEQNLHTFSKDLFFLNSNVGIVADLFILYCFQAKWNILQTRQLCVEVSQFAVDMQATFSKRNAIYIL